MRTLKRKIHLDYTKEIDKFYQEFPELKGRVFVINPAVHKSAKHFIEENKRFAQILHEYQSAEKLAQIGKTQDEFSGLINNEQEIDSLYKKGSYCVDIFDCVNFNGEFISLVIPQKPREKINSQFISAFDKASFKEAENPEIAEKFTLYHELGHAIYNQNNKSNAFQYVLKEDDEQFKYNTEAAAESYALIRMIQEYGVDHPAIELRMIERTLDRLEYAGSNYNFLPSLHEVIRLGKEGALDNLTPRQAAKLAEKIVKENVITNRQAKKLEEFMDEAYLALYFSRDLRDGLGAFTHSLAITDDTIIIRDANYIIQCLGDLTSNSPKLQAQVKKMWSALKANPKTEKLTKQGKLTQHFRVKSLKAKPHQSLMQKLKTYIRQRSKNKLRL